MKPATTGRSKDYSVARSTPEKVMPAFPRLCSLQQCLPTIPVTRLLLVLLLACPACANKNGRPAEHPDIPFDKAKWSKKTDGAYIYRKQMVADLLHNYVWTGVRKDSLVRLLGQPDHFEETENLLMYYYETTPALGGLATKIDALNFELGPDSTVKEARLNDGAELPGGGHWD